MIQKGKRGGKRKGTFNSLDDGLTFEIDESQ